MLLATVLVLLLLLCDPTVFAQQQQVVSPSALSDCSTTKRCFAVAAECFGAVCSTSSLSARSPSSSACGLTGVPASSGAIADSIAPCSAVFIECLTSEFERSSAAADAACTSWHHQAALFMDRLPPSAVAALSCPFLAPDSAAVKSVVNTSLLGQYHSSSAGFSSCHLGSGSGAALCECPALSASAARLLSAGAGTLLSRLPGVTFASAGKELRTRVVESLSASMQQHRFRLVRNDSSSSSVSSCSDLSASLLMPVALPVSTCAAVLSPSASAQQLSLVTSAWWTSSNGEDSDEAALNSLCPSRVCNSTVLSDEYVHHLFFSTNSTSASSVFSAAVSSFFYVTSASGDCLVPHPNSSNCACPLLFDVVLPGINVTAVTALVNGDKELMFASLVFCVPTLAARETAGSDDRVSPPVRAILANESGRAAVISSFRGRIVGRVPVVSWKFTASSSSSSSFSLQRTHLYLVLDIVELPSALANAGIAAAACVTLLVTPLVGAQTLPLIAAAMSISSECSAGFFTSGQLGLRSVAPASIYRRPAPTNKNTQQNRRPPSGEYAGLLAFVVIVLCIAPIVLHVSLVIVWTVSCCGGHHHHHHHHHQQQQHQPDGGQSTSSSHHASTSARRFAPYIGKKGSHMQVNHQHHMQHHQSSVAAHDASSIHQPEPGDVQHQRTGPQQQHQWAAAMARLAFPDLSAALLFALTPIITHLSIRLLGSSGAAADSAAAAGGSIALLFSLCMWALFFRASYECAMQQGFFHTDVKFVPSRPAAEWPQTVAPGGGGSKQAACPDAVFVDFEPSDYEGETCVAGWTTLVPSGTWLLDETLIRAVVDLPDPAVEPFATPARGGGGSGGASGHRRSSASHHGASSSCFSSSSFAGWPSLARSFSCVTRQFRVKYALAGPVVLLGMLLLFSVLTALPPGDGVSCAAIFYIIIVLLVVVGFVSLIARPFRNTHDIPLFPTTCLLAIFAVRIGITGDDDDHTGVAVFAAVVGVTMFWSFISLLCIAAEMYIWQPKSVAQHLSPLTKLRNDVEVTATATTTATTAVGQSSSAPPAVQLMRHKVSPWTVITADSGGLHSPRTQDVEVTDLEEEHHQHKKKNNDDGRDDDDEHATKQQQQQQQSKNNKNERWSDYQWKRKTMTDDISSSAGPNPTSAPVSVAPAASRPSSSPLLHLPPPSAKAQGDEDTELVQVRSVGSRRSSLTAAGGGGPTITVGSSSDDAAACAPPSAAAAAAAGADNVTISSAPSSGRGGSNKKLSPTPSGQFLKASSLGALGGSSTSSGSLMVPPADDEKSASSIVSNVSSVESGKPK